MVLRRPITVDGDKYWKDFSKNVDGLGSSINEYARRSLVSSLTYGHSAILIDFPNDPHFDAPRRDSKRSPPLFHQHRRPTNLGLAPESTNPPQNSQVRLHSGFGVPEGDFGEKREEQIRVIRPGTFETWNTEVSSALERIRRTSRSSRFTATEWACCQQPPLLDIASLNITHYQRRGPNQRAPHRGNAHSRPRLGRPTGRHISG